MATVGWMGKSGVGLGWQNGKAFSHAQRLSSGVESGWRNTAKAYSSGMMLDSSMAAALSIASILETAVASTSSCSTVFLLGVPALRPPVLLLAIYFVYFFYFSSICARLISASQRSERHLDANCHPGRALLALFGHSNCTDE